MANRNRQAKPRKPRPRICPWCKQKGTTQKREDGFWYCGCFGGICPVSPCTSGHETEEEAIRDWNNRS